MTVADEMSGQERALGEYLDALGIGDYAPIFGKHGVTSLPLLKLLAGPTGATVRAAVQADVTAGVAPVAGSPLAAQVVETITPATVQAWLTATRSPAVRGPGNRPSPIPRSRPARSGSPRR